MQHLEGSGKSVDARFLQLNCNWVATRWQLFSTHIHTNNTGNVTKQTIHRTTQKIHRTTQQLGRVRAVPRLCGCTLEFALQLRKKHGKTSVRVAINISQGIHKYVKGGVHVQPLVPQITRWSKFLKFSISQIHLTPFVAT